MQADPIGDSALWASWFFENAHDLFVIVRPEGRRILAANPIWEAITGWRPDELVGLDLFDLIWPGDVAKLRAIRPQLADQGAPLEPFRLRRKDGAWLWLEGYARQGPGGEMVGVVRDITEERRRQLKLEAADKLRFMLSETAGVGAWSYDPRTDMLDWSPELRALLAKSGVRLDTDAAKFEAHCHPDDLEQVSQVVDHVATTGQAAAFDHRFRASDGRWIHMRVHARGERLGDGLYLVHGLSQDVTELAEAREAAQAAERQSWRLIEQAPFAVALFDKDLRYSMVSPRWVELFQPASPEALGKRLDEVSTEAYAGFVKLQELALTGVVTRSEDDRLVDSRGKTFWIRWEVGPWRDGSGAIIGVVIYVDDVSAMTAARRESQTQERRLKIALGAAKAAVVETDFEGDTVWSSPELFAMTGYDLTGAVGDTIWHFVHPDDTEWLTQVVHGWFAGEAIEPVEARILTLDGRERWVRIYSELERGADGAWRKAVNLLIDIDHSKRQELALIEAERAANAAAEAKAQFLANMSHEIRTPMNGVLGVLHLLERQPLPDEAVSMLAEALACGRMLQALLDDVVDFSRIEAGRLDLASEPLDPAAVLDSVVGLLRGQAEGKGLAVSVATEGLPAWVLGDPVRLRQCLFNLMGNAVKFTAEGHIAVRASISDDAAGRRLRFEFEDTGVGIDTATRDRLFERFQQADATTTRRFGGSGLGLAITRKLAELMGGSVGVRSALGAGSTFWLEIPAAAASSPRAAPSDVGPVLDGLRLLVVEDNPTNRMIATKILESLGAAVETADDGEQGVAAATRGGFDLILMDIQMPGIDGIEATRRIRAAPGPVAETPIVALTANVLTHQREVYLASGMNGVVGKPISPAVLLAEIARIAAADEDQAAQVSAARAT